MNHTLRVRSAAGDHCVRLRPDSLGQSSQMFAAERFAAPLAIRAGLACARLLGTVRLETEPGWSAAIFETVDGTRLDNILASGSNAQRATVALKLGRDLAGLHALPCVGFGTFRAIDERDGRTFVSNLLNAEREPLARFDPALARLYDERIQAATQDPDLPARQPCFVHGDVHARNLIVQGDRLVWLDWEACRSRLPEFDFAQLPFTTWRGDTCFRDETIKSYRAYSRASARIDAELLHLVQIYWHVRFGLFLRDCPLPVDTAYFGSFDEHLDHARALLLAAPAGWARALAGEGAPP